MEEKALRVLAVEDSALDYELLLATLAMQGVECSGHRVETAAQLVDALRSSAWDIVISDHRMPGFSSTEALAIVRAQPSPPPFIIVSGVIGEDSAVDAMRNGADDYLVKGRLVRLAKAVRNAVDAAAERRARAEIELQLRNLSERMHTLIEEERCAIAREIHDDVGGALTAARFDLDALARHVPDAQQPRLERARSALQHAFDAAGRIMRDLRPPILDAGLAAAIEWQADAFALRTGIAVTVNAPALEHKLPDRVAMAVFRTCQEALTNVVKHANASHVNIELAERDGELVLAIRDDGRGLVAGALGQPDSLGLRGLAERARAAGGTLNIEGRAGTEITLRVPLAAHREGAPT